MAMSGGSLKRRAKWSNGEITWFLTSTINFDSISLPSPTGHRYRAITFSAKTTSPLAFLRQSRLRSRPWQSLAGVAESEEKRSAGGLRSFSRFHYRHLLTLIVVALWGIPALLQTHGEFFSVGIGRHVIGRSLATMEGHGAGSLGAYLLLLPFYFVTVFLSFFPWSIKLPWLVQKLLRRNKTGVTDPGYSRNSIDTYLATGIAIVFIIFTFVSTKLPHYTLPAFPLLTLLFAWHWRP